ncbi:MAG: glycosyltransferase, partial [bacterium]|nr:glycosyltransferase [bacterium]
AQCRDVEKYNQYANSTSKHKRLRIGYVSPDFCWHSVAYFIEPVIAAHNRNACEIYCYSAVKRPDDVTVRIKGAADVWRDIYEISNERVAEMVRADRIDILVDLTGHTAGNCLKVFARKPAPVQVTWIGYPNTTGLSSVDYRITDNYADPGDDDEQLYTEKLVRMPQTFLCYRPYDRFPDVGPLPSVHAGFVTFGSFNNLSKINMEVVALWAGILQKVSGSQLLLKSSQLEDRETKARFEQYFADYGITHDRLLFVGQDQDWVNHLDLYNRVDIALDPFPYNGTTTTCEALWMGVPVVALKGDRHSGRVGVSLLSNIGLEE